MTVSDLALSKTRAVGDAEGYGHKLGTWSTTESGKEASAACLTEDCVLVVRITDAYAHSHHWFVSCPFTKEYQDSLR